MEYLTTQSKPGNSDKIEVDSIQENVFPNILIVFKSNLILYNLFPLFSDCFGNAPPAAAQCSSSVLLLFICFQWQSPSFPIGREPLGEHASPDRGASFSRP